MNGANRLKQVSTKEIARRLGLEQGKNKNFKCFNTPAHKNADAHPSLSIMGDGFNCFACGVKGGKINLVEQVLNIDRNGAWEWFNKTFGYNGKPKAKKWHIRRISAGKNRFVFVPNQSDKNPNFREPNQEDIQNIKNILRKEYSLATLKKAGVKICTTTYGLAFPKDNLRFNPENKKKSLYLEGRTDWLTAIELALYKHFELLSIYNKTIRITLPRGEHTFILDEDDTPENRKTRISAKEDVELRFVRLPKPFKDLSDWFNGAGCTATDVLTLIESTPVEKIEPVPNLPFQSRCTDVANADRFSKRNNQKVRFCLKMGIWYLWDGTRWKPDDTGEIYQVGEETARLIFDEVKDLNEPAEMKMLSRWAVQSLMRNKIKDMVSLAGYGREIAVRPDDLDSDPWKFNTISGTIDLVTGELKPHRRDDLVTKLAPVEYNKNAECPNFLGFLHYIFQNSQAPDELIGFLQRFFGYSLTGKATDDIFPIFWGSGANGKSTLLETITTMMGDYSKSAARDLFLTKRGDNHPTGLADLHGARLVTTIETDEDRRLAESLVKQMTGGDKVKARFMRQDYFEFEPTFKIVLATNHRPSIHGTDYAIWRRIKLVPFTFNIPPEKRDPKIRDFKFRDEWPGILNWLVKGCLEWQQSGLKPPAEIEEATEEYRSESDIIGDWLNECTVSGREYETKAKELYEDYCKFKDIAGEKPVTQTTFGRRLRERGIDKLNKGGRIYYKGIALKKEPVFDEPPF